MNSKETHQMSPKLAGTPNDDRIARPKNHLCSTSFVWEKRPFSFFFIISAIIIIVIVIIVIIVIIAIVIIVISDISIRTYATAFPRVEELNLLVLLLQWTPSSFLINS